MTVNQRIPPFFEDAKRAIVVVNSCQELLNLPFLVRISNAVGFHRYSVDDNRVMAEFIMGKGHNEKKSWYVTALCSGEDAKQILIELPKWTSNKS